MPLGYGQLAIHKGSYLIHIQINIGKILWLDIVNVGKAFQNAAQ
jgi:hypothetical protein